MNVKLLGLRIKQLRAERKMTLQDVGKLAGVSKSLLSKVENSQVMPPISTLSKIAAALDAPICYFFQEDVRQDLGVFVPRDGRQRVDAGPHGPDYTYEHLSHGVTFPRLMEPFVISLAPESQQQAELYDHPGEEFVLVLEGEMDFMFGNAVYRMEVGDSMYIDARVPHGPAQVDGLPVAYLAVLTNR